MRIRIATKGWNGSAGTSIKNGAEPTVGIRIPWVELDGYRTSDVLSATVEAGANDATVVTLKFTAAAEMVLLDESGEIIA